MTRFLIGICVPLLAACEAETPLSHSTEGLRALPPKSVPAQEVARWNAVLGFVNAPDTSFEVLDIDVGLDRRAAERIIRHRDGMDRTSGTEDDNFFDSLDELLSLDWVGPSALEHIEAWLEDAATDGELVEGVAFTDDEAILVVSLANTAEAAYLDDDLELDVRAVEGIIDARPLADLGELADVHYVGPATLERLRAAVTQ